MNPVLDFLNQTVFMINETPTTWAEIFGFVLGVATVYLVAVNNIWTFPIGILQASFFWVLFIDAKLYSDAWLQVFFIVIQFFGWWAWLKAGPNRTKLTINNTPKWAIPLSLAAIVTFAIIMVPILRNAHGAYPVPDATSTSLSVMAQILLSFKLIENWWLWIAADLIYIPLYFVKGLYFTSVLYVVFLGLCVVGLRHWTRVKRGEGNGKEPNSAYALEQVELQGSTEMGTA